MARTLLDEALTAHIALEHAQQAEKQARQMLTQAGERFKEAYQALREAEKTREAHDGR